MKYENFDILLREELDDSFTVLASHNFHGRAESAPHNFQYDVEEGELTDLLSYLQELVAEKNDLEELGKQMYALLFSPAVSELYMALWERLREKNGNYGVRIRLDIRSAVSRNNTLSPLSHLPWEYCFDEKNNKFLGKDIQTPIIRYIPRGYIADPLTPGNNKLRILMVLSNPSDVPPLNVQTEEKIMRDALGTQLGNNIELKVLTEVTSQRLHHSIDSFDPHIIHFVGHGIYEDNQGALVIEADDGKARSLTASQLAGLVQGRSVKIVVLNACDTSAVAAGAKAFSSTAVGLVYARVPAVIAMQFRVPDHIALQFTKTLYEQIAKGEPLDKAVAQMRLSVSLGSSEDEQILWGIPTLYMRASNGLIWVTDKPQPELTRKEVTDKPQPELTRKEMKMLETRENLIKRVHSTWIEGVLLSALKGKPQIKIGKISMHTAVQQLKPKWLFSVPDEQVRFAEQTIEQVFEMCDHRLLILGAPASGKTITLLTLAKLLLNRAQENYEARIPLVVNLATWSITQESLEHWLREELFDSYGFGRKVSPKWIEDDQFIFFV